MNLISRGFPLIIVSLIGLVFGLGFQTFHYAEGLSYMSDDPKVCKNCHIMNEQYDSWQKGPHHNVATCNDCHVPHNFFAKYLAKAENGYHHSKGFTLQDFHEPILIKEKNGMLLQENCLRCHSDFVHDVVEGNKSKPDSIRCVHCHRSVGHGAFR